MPDQNKPDQNKYVADPLVTFMLLLAASTPDPDGKLNTLSQAINSMREAVNSIHAGLETFHTQVLPMFIRKPEHKR